jgi:microcompartment protein CcmL/EutN
MQRALALIEFSGPAAGILAVDRMLKMAPVALLRCGTVHPGRYLALVGGSVAATQEAHAEGLDVASAQSALEDEVCLPDPHPQLAAAVTGERIAPGGDTVGVIEIATSPGLLRAVDAALKEAPVDLVELRLADDLGGNAVALISGDLTDVEAAMAAARERTPVVDGWRAGTVMPRLDDTLRDVLAAGTRFGPCRAWEPAGAETVEE